MSFLWCTVHVKNLDESIKFYEKFVKSSVNRRFEAGLGVERAFLGDGGDTSHNFDKFQILFGIYDIEEEDEDE